MLTVELNTSTAELVELAPEWDELLARAEHSEPTQSPLWLSTWWQVFGAKLGASLLLCAVRDRDRLIGVAPLYRTVHWYRGIPFRRLALLGTGENEADEIMSDYLGVTAERGREAEVAQAIASRLVADDFGPWEEFLYCRVRDDGPLFPALAEALAARGDQVQVTSSAVCHYVPLPATFEDYLRALKPSRRQLARRSLRDFEAWAGHPLELERADSTVTLAAGEEILVKLHEERWGERRSHGAFESPLFRGFHHRVMRQLFDRQALDLLTLSARGQPVAALYNFVWQGRVHFYQSGRAMDLPDQLRPGLVIHLLAIRNAIARGLKEYDFLGGDARYKQQLGLASRPLVDLRLTRAGCRREFVRQWLTVGARAARSKLLQVRQKQPVSSVHDR